MKSSVLVGLIVDGESTAALTVTLERERWARVSGADPLLDLLVLCVARIDRDETFSGTGSSSPPVRC